MRIEPAAKSEVFTIFDAPKLDPVTVVLQDLGPGAGRLIVECYGSAWSGYWGAMGSDTVRQFLITCHPQYIAGKMFPIDRKMKKNEEAYLDRIIAAVHASLTATI